MKLFLLLAAALLPQLALAELELNSLFTDHMVLQRDKVLPVWGTAEPGAEVSIQFAGQKKTVQVAKNGKWEIKLDALKGSYDGRELIVTSNKKTQKISDVVVGEVWICSGQSNMQFSVNSVPELKALTKDAKDIRTFDVPRTVSFKEEDTCKGKWADRIPSSAVAFGFAYDLQAAADVPVGIILTCWGSSSLEAWMPRDMTETVPHFKTIMKEFDADSDTRKQIITALDKPKGWSKPEDIFLRRQPNILYNAMMHPLAPFACRGVVWYQGERNTQSMKGMLKKPWFSRNSGMLIYGDVLKKWAQRYRQEWKQEDLEFLVVMLPGYGKTTNPAAHSWAWMRESQMKILELENTAVANTIDLGDTKNIHPRDKQPIGKRLALLAQRNTLGQKIKAEGPMMSKVETTGDTLVVHFKNANGLKTKDNQSPTAFWIADSSGKWQPAEATIKGETIILHNSKIKKPIYVRYAFVGKPDVNLVNGVNLPAYPFRNDKLKP